MLFQPRSLHTGLLLIGRNMLASLARKDLAAAVVLDPLGTREKLIYEKRIFFLVRLVFSSV
jgi:hypothetical protein